VRMASLLQALTSSMHECAEHIVPFATVRLAEPKAHKPAHSKSGQEVSDMLGKDHALLDRIQGAWRLLAGTRCQHCEKRRARVHLCKKCYRSVSWEA
jgi:hypothetical protein